MMSSAATVRIDRVLVSVDFGDASTHAARWVASYFAPDAEIILAHVIEPPPATRANVMRYPSVETIVSKVHLVDQQRLTELCESIAPGRARTEIRVGTPHEELVQLSTGVGADIIVMGRQDLSSSGWARVGATAQRVLRKSTIPILLVAGPREHRPARILVAIDESDMTGDVLRWGAFLSEEFSAKATVMHAAGADAPAGEDDDWITGEIEKFTVEKAMEQRVTRAAVRPAESIIAEARSLGSELIIIGSRGAGDADQRIFGTVAEGVLLSSPCPVLVVLPTG